MWRVDGYCQWQTHLHMDETQNVVHLERQYIYDTEKRLVELKVSDIHEHLNVEYKKRL